MGRVADYSVLERGWVPSDFLAAVFHPYIWRLSVLLLLAGIIPATAQTNATMDLILVQDGALPIILTAPHGGALPIPGVPSRTNGTITTDSRTFELTTAINEHLTKLLGSKPYLVAAKFQRKFLDVNRPPAEAYSDDKAKPVYEAYHGQIRNFLDIVREKYPQGALLVDIHGQSLGTNRIYRGTQNGVTVMHLLQVHGEVAFLGTNSLFGRLQGAGYDVFPPNTPPGKPAEERSLNGGHTVGRYGSHRTNGVDAIQIEFGSALRLNAQRREQLAQDTAGAIAAYYRAYLAMPKKGEP